MITDCKALALGVPQLLDSVLMIAEVCFGTIYSISRGYYSGKSSPDLINEDCFCYPHFFVCFTLAV